MPPPAEGFAARFVLGPALRTQPDRRLVTLVREGYESAFEEIVRRYGRALTRYAAAIVGGHAEDVTQDAFSKALLALRRDDGEIELRPWLFRIVRNTALNDLRDSPPSAAALAEVIATGCNPAEELERREELTDLMQRLQSLPEAQRAAIVMRELEGLSHEEIASALGLSDGGARQAIYRARRSLRDGIGMLLPLPLLKALLVGTANSPAVEAAAGAAGVGGAAGAGVALKAAAATVLVAGAVGTGVAIDRDRESRPEPAAARGAVSADSQPAPPASTPVTGTSEGGLGERSDRGRGREESEPGEDRRSHGEGGEDRSGPGDGDNREPEREDDDQDRSGPGGHDQAGSTDDRGGRSGPSRHTESDDHGDGHSGGGLGSSSGPGSGSSGDSGDPDDSSGPGSGDSIASDSGSESSSSSGSFGSGGSSGSESGDDESGSGESG
ncbi:MAG TPA: sigma-70 family RNA polymerase sigma factor [Solirubrobacterales bacterium]|nr:sigma-70 family RNA polymerase sigma factor [Solirubrobacterales bacterium]